MTGLEFFLVALLWYIIGVACMIFWWTKDYDLDTQDLGVMLILGIFGPFGLLFGWSCSYNSSTSKPKIILKKRK